MKTRNPNKNSLGKVHRNAIRQALLHSLEDIDVVLVRADPKPRKAVLRTMGYRAIGSPDLHRPDIALGLQTERRMVGVLPE